MTWLRTVAATFLLIGLAGCEEEEALPTQPITLDDGLVLEFVTAVDVQNWATDEYFTQLSVKWPDWEDGDWAVIKSIMPETCDKIIAHLRANDPEFKERPDVILSIAESDTSGILTVNKSQAIQFKLEDGGCVDLFGLTTE